LEEEVELNFKDTNFNENKILFEKFMKSKVLLFMICTENKPSHYFYGQCL